MNNDGATEVVVAAVVATKLPQVVATIKTKNIAWKNANSESKSHCKNL